MTKQKPEPSDEVKKNHVKEALDISGFEENMEFYVKQHKGKTKIVVDFSDDKKAVYFRVGSSKITLDDQDGTLAKVGKIIIDAEQGIMPDTPVKDEEKPIQKPIQKPVPSYGNKGPDTPKEQSVFDQPTDQVETPPAELVFNTAVPARDSFQPQGMMIMDIQPGIAEVGAIKIGGKGKEMKSQKSGQTYRLPVKYDHFVIRTKHKGEDGDYTIDPIMKEWGYSGTFEDGPLELDIFLLYNDPTANFLTSYRQYKGGKCMCSGNGIEAVKADGTKIQCNTETCPILKSKQCKPNGILSVILKDAPIIGGVHVFRTTSYNSIRQILTSLFFIQSATGGYLANIPLKMTLTPKTVNPADSPTAQTAYIVNIVFPGSVEDLHKETIKLVKERASMKNEILQIEAQAKRALCAPESEEAIMEIEEEFYPDAEV